jgi:hypothetical protein
VDIVVNNAGYFSKPFGDRTAGSLMSLRVDQEVRPPVVPSLVLSLLRIRASGYETTPPTSHPGSVFTYPLTEFPPIS